MQVCWTTTLLGQLSVGQRTALNSQSKKPPKLHVIGFVGPSGQCLGQTKPGHSPQIRYLLHERISGLRARQDRLGISSSVEGKVSGPVALLGTVSVIRA